MRRHRVPLGLSDPVFGLFGALAVAAGQSGLFPGETERLGWGYALHHPVEGVLAGMTTFYQPNYMDILPVFMWCMLALPVFAALEARVGDWALVLPLGLYAAAHVLGLAPPVLETDTHGGFRGVGEIPIQVLAYSASATIH